MRRTAPHRAAAASRANNLYHTDIYVPSAREVEPQRSPERLSLLRFLWARDVSRVLS